ncbi:Uncharacterized protein HZ326_13034 [Fusarium oxysporum f. sp. albedinis]|nr:Uncharacterized protein HZ326_13034 [Fusarium oxysporum f. sp. albedinis]
MCLNDYPCFDERSMKAEFTLSILVDESFVRHSLHLRALQLSRRAISMSTYVRAKHLAGVKCTNSKIPISVFCPLTSEEQATFSVGLTAKGLQFLEGSFELPYPLPKLDLIRIPEVSTGATENWGAINFKTTNLLLDPGDSTIGTKHRIAETILHEISLM